MKSIIFCLSIFSCIILSLANTECTKGLYMSIWKHSENVELTAWVQRNVLDTLRTQENTENAIFANSIQPAETNEYMNYAELMVKEGILDIFDVDIVYAGRFKNLTSDLNNFPVIKNLTNFLDEDLKKYYSDGKRLIAFPWKRDQGVLIYRKDLLKKYKYSEIMPQNDDFTWEKMEEIAMKIKKKEKHITEGYAWQGKNYEGLTCNVMEWFASDGLNSSIIEDDKIVLNKVNRDIAIKSFERVAGWISKSKITSAKVIEDTEDSVKQRFVDGEILFLRTWNGHYDIIQKDIQRNNQKNGLEIPMEIGVSFLPRGNKLKAATLGGWGISMNKFEGEREGKNNLCRETNAEKALSILANSTTLEYFYSTFQRFPPFNREYMEKICTNINNSKTIPCILTNMTMKDKHGNIIRKIVSRPDVSKNYHEKSETIYDFVNMFLALQVYQIPFESTDNKSDISKLSNASKMIDQMRCVLEKELSSEAGDGVNRLNELSRTENNRVLFLENHYCEHDFSFINIGTTVIGWFFVSIIYIISLGLVIWILMNYNHVVVNHSQPFFLIIVLFGVCCNVSTIIPFLIDESKISECQELRGKENYNVNEYRTNFTKQCQEQLDAACRSIPFLYSYGFVLTYSALLVKLWRIEKIFHNKKLRRLKLNMKHLLSLIVCCIIVATVINLFWISSCESFVDGEGFTWWRKEIVNKNVGSKKCKELKLIDPQSPKPAKKQIEFCNKYYETYYDQVFSTSVGMCRFSQATCDTTAKSDNVEAGGLPPTIWLQLTFVILFLTYGIWLGFKTRNIATSYNEGKFILISLVNHLQLIVVFIAIVNSVNINRDPSAYVLIISCVIGFSNLCTLAFIFGPKVFVFLLPEKAKKSFRLRRVPTSSVDEGSPRENSAISSPTSPNDIELTGKK